MSEPIKIRTHHVKGAEMIVRGGIDTYEDSMWEHDYVNSRDDPSIAKTYNAIISLLNRPETDLVELVVGKPDFICELCPKYLDNRCNHFGDNLGIRTDLASAVSLRIYDNGNLKKSLFTIGEIKKMMNISDGLLKRRTKEAVLEEAK